MDPRRFDLHQLLAAYEFTLKQGCKDEAAWNRLRGQIYAEPKEVRDERRAAAQRRLGDRIERILDRSSTALSVDAAEAMLAQFAASDAQYGAA